MLVPPLISQCWLVSDLTIVHDGWEFLSYVEKGYQGVQHSVAKSLSLVVTLELFVVCD